MIPQQTPYYSFNKDKCPSNQSKTMSQRTLFVDINFLFTNRIVFSLASNAFLSNARKQRFYVAFLKQTGAPITFCSEFHLEMNWHFFLKLIRIVLPIESSIMLRHERRGCTFCHMGIINIIHVSLLEGNRYSVGKHRQKA